MEGSIKSRRSFFSLDILEFQQQRNEWWSSTSLNAFNRDFHKAANFNFLRSFIIRHFSFSWEIFLPIFLILVTGLIWTRCYVSSLTINIKNIYSHSIFFILQFLTFSVHLEMQNYKFYLTNSLVQTFYFSVPQTILTLCSISLDYWKALLSLLHHF